MRGPPPFRSYAAPAVAVFGAAHVGPGSARTDQHARGALNLVLVPRYRKEVAALERLEVQYAHIMDVSGRESRMGGVSER